MNFTNESFGLASHPLLDPSQTTRSPAGPPHVQAGNSASLPLFNSGMPRISALQHSVITGTNRHQGATLLSFEAMRGGRQRTPLTDPYGIQQGNSTLTRGRSSVPFNTFMGDMPHWNQVNGVADAGMAVNNLFGFQAAMERDASVRATQYQQHATTNSLSLPSFNDTSLSFLSNTMYQQLPTNATHYQSFNDQQKPSPFSAIHHFNATEREPTLNALHYGDIDCQPSTRAPVKSHRRRKTAPVKQPSVRRVSNAAGPLLTQMHRPKTRSLLAKEVKAGSPSRDAIENPAIHHAASPAHLPDAAMQGVVPDGNQSTNEHTAVPPLSHESTGNTTTDEASNAVNHISATTAAAEQVQRIMTESPVMDERMAPPAQDVPADSPMAAPADPQEQVEDLAPPAMQWPIIIQLEEAPRIIRSPAKQSREDSSTGEQAAPASANAPQAAEASKDQLIIEFAQHSSDSESSSRPRHPNYKVRFASGFVPKAPGVRPLSSANGRDEGPPAKRARLTRSQRGDRSPVPTPAQTPTPDPVEPLALFAPLPAKDTVLGHATATGQAGPSTQYSYRADMTLYDIFVGMKAENDRNMATGSRNASGDITFTWSESDMKFLDSLRGPRCR